MKKSVGTIPKFIKARSEKSLQRLMLKTQLRLGYGVNWFDVQETRKGWVAWYYDNDTINQYNVEAQLGSNKDDGNK